MTGALIALGVLNITSSGCCCGAWTKEFWPDKNERQLFFRELRIVRIDRSAEDESARTWQLAFQQRLENGECPYGSTMPLDVTWPSVPEDIAMFVEPMTKLKFLAVVYGYVLLLPVGFVLIDTAKQLFSRGEMRHLWILLWLGLLLCVNEFIVKKLVAEPRPGSMMELRGRHGLLEGSCVDKCGMPSSHSAIAMGWLTLSILDAVSRTVSGADSQSTSDVGSPVSAERQKWGEFFMNFCCIPWEKKDHLNLTELISIVLYWWVLLAPVPFMRVVLRDHSERQAVYGCAIGIALAVIWWRVLRVLERFGISMRRLKFASQSRPGVGSSYAMESRSTDLELSQLSVTNASR